MNIHVYFHRKISFNVANNGLVQLWCSSLEIFFVHTTPCTTVVNGLCCAASPNYAFRIWMGTLFHWSLLNPLTLLILRSFPRPCTSPTHNFSSDVHAPCPREDEQYLTPKLKPLSHVTQWRRWKITWRAQPFYFSVHFPSFFILLCPRSPHLSANIVYPIRREPLTVLLGVHYSHSVSCASLFNLKKNLNSPTPYINFCHKSRAHLVFAISSLEGRQRDFANESYRATSLHWGEASRCPSARSVIRVSNDH